MRQNLSKASGEHQAIDDEKTSEKAETNQREM